MAGNHPWEKNSANIPREEIFYGWKSSLRGETSKYSAGGNILWPEIILGERNQQIRMNSVAGNHPCEKKPANQDEIRGRKSSLGGEICK